MKLKPLHLFLILLAVLLLTCCLGNNSVFEGEVSFKNVNFLDKAQFRNVRFKNTRIISKLR